MKQEIVQALHLVLIIGCGCKDTSNFSSISVRLLSAVK